MCMVYLVNIELVCVKALQVKIKAEYFCIGFLLIKEDLNIFLPTSKWERREKVCLSGSV